MSLEQVALKRLLAPTSLKQIIFIHALLEQILSVIIKVVSFIAIFLKLVGTNAPRTNAFWTKVSEPLFDQEFSPSFYPPLLSELVCKSCPQRHCHLQGQLTHVGPGTCSIIHYGFVIYGKRTKFIITLFSIVSHKHRIHTLPICDILYHRVLGPVSY